MNKLLDEIEENAFSNPLSNPFEAPARVMYIKIPHKTPIIVIIVLVLFFWIEPKISCQVSFWKSVFIYLSLSASIGLILAALLAGINPAIPPKIINIIVANNAVLKSTYGSVI